MRTSILQNNIQGEPAILDWDSVCFEVEYFYRTNKEMFNQLSGGEELSVNETAQEVFLALILDYALSKGPDKELIKLSYRLAEA